jgi:small subunit ribosomal protein S1
MAALLAEEGSRVFPERGEIIEGTIVSKSPAEIVVDICCKSEGIVGARDLERLEPEFLKQLQVGSQVFVYIVRPQDAEGRSILSLSRAMLEGDWKMAEELYDSKEVIETTVSAANKGGLIVHIGRVRAFVPASQIVSVRLPREASDEERMEQLNQLVGQKLHLKIIELDRRRNRLILSERVAMREWRQDRKNRLLDELKEGEVREGEVSSLCDFGAFVDLGGADGLVHLSELSWRHVEHPREVLKVGQRIKVHVLGVDRDRRRIALSIKRIQPEPWSTVEERYEIGQLVNGTITKITEFGAFARLDEDIEGLIHISELSEDRIAHPSAVVQEGQEVSLRVIRIDAARRRLGLSLRRVSDTEYFDDYDWENVDPLDETDDLGEEGDAE